MNSGWITLGPESRWNSSGTRVPSISKPVELGDAPRTTGNGNSDTTDATPGSAWITRNGSPNVPGTCWSSGPRSEIRETSSRHCSPTTKNENKTKRTHETKNETPSTKSAATCSCCSNGSCDGAYTVSFAAH